MANYIINECITNDVYILSASTLTLGATVEFDINEARFCGTVGAVTESTETLNITFIQLHDDCCECLVGNRGSLNFHFIRCDTSEDISIEATNFCTEYGGAPTTGLIYEIQFGSDTPFCATFEGLSETGVTNYSYVSGPFSLCDNCGEEPEPPISSNTEYTMCIEICDGTYESQDTPHPVYTDGYGTPITQLNMVALGGPNGLNS